MDKANTGEQPVRLYRNKKNRRAVYIPGNAGRMARKVRGNQPGQWLIPIPLAHQVRLLRIKEQEGRK